MATPTRTLLSWSSGKDCAWALHRLRQRDDIAVVGLLSTFNAEAERVAMHGVRASLARAQAAAAALPLWEVPLPSPCSNADYERIMAEVFAQAKARGIEAIAFGDLHLADIRAYRERQLAPTGLKPLFPLWGGAADSPALAREMVAGGLRAVLACIDSRQLDPAHLGAIFDAALLDRLPAGVDPCGENGEFHTFCTHAPCFAAPIAVRTGERVDREGFAFIDLLPAP